MALVFKNRKITSHNDIFAPFFHTEANPNPIRFAKSMNFKEFIVLRKHKLLDKATNELVTLMSALWVPREHTGSVRHALPMDEMGTDQRDRCQEVLRSGGWAAGRADFCCPGAAGGTQGQARMEPELQDAGETVFYSYQPLIN